MTTIPTTAPANAQRLTITADTNAEGKWILVDNGGNIADNFGYETREEAMSAARQLWPAYFPWFGQEDGDGWSIVIG